MLRKNSEPSAWIWQSLAMRRPTWRGSCARSCLTAARASGACRAAGPRTAAPARSRPPCGSGFSAGRRPPGNRPGRTACCPGSRWPPGARTGNRCGSSRGAGCGRHRVEEGLGALGLAVVRQQADEFLLHLLPERGLRIVQRGGPAVRAAAPFAADLPLAASAPFGPAAPPGPRSAFELRGAFAHAHVVVLDALARQALDAVPVARFIQRLGALREQRVVAVEAGQDALGDVARRGPGTGACSMRWTSDMRIMAARGRAVDQAVSANSSRPISMRRISLVPAPIS